MKFFAVFDSSVPRSGTRTYWAEIIVIYTCFTSIDVLDSVLSYESGACHIFYKRFKDRPNRTDRVGLSTNSSRVSRRIIARR